MTRREMTLEKATGIAIKGSPIALIAALGALVLPAQAPAKGAKVASYLGPVSQASRDPLVAAPTIEFQFASSKHRKRLRMAVSSLVVRNLWYTCANGKAYYPGAGTSETTSKVRFEAGGIRVNKHRQFSGAESPGEEFGKGFAVTGQVLRNGTATGTVRIFDSAEASPETGACDSGVLTWTANRVR